MKTSKVVIVETRRSNENNNESFTWTGAQISKSYESISKPILFFPSKHFSTLTNRLISLPLLPALIVSSSRILAIGTMNSKTVQVSVTKSQTLQLPL